ncbi:MAG: carboxypeptidase-like regulatory domain-containing protein, partial [Candidatus Sericytochromatia bacterium]
MISKKLTSLGLTMAMTASLSLLAGCPAPTTTEPSASSSASVAPSASASVAPSSSAMPSASASAMPSSSVAPSASGSTTPSSSASAPTTSSSTTPTETTGTTSDIKEKATFNGTVYDTNDVPVDGAKVVATSIDPAVTWKGEDQITAGGSYVFRNAPVGVRILITVSKDGWTTRTQTQVLKSNLTGNPEANKFDFSDKDAIQDEPEVTGLKINDKVVTGAGKILDGSMFTLSDVDMGESEQRPASNTSANLSAVDASNLKFEFAFSEAVDKED